MKKEILKQIKQVIDNNLEIRGINVETKLDYDDKKNQFNLTSTKFQTFPVIHFNLSIINFGGSILKNEKIDNISEIYIPVAVKYDGNCENLFSFSCRMREDLDEIFKINVSHITNN